MRKEIIEKTIVIMLVCASMISITGCNVGGDLSKKTNRENEAMNMVYNEEEVNLPKLQGDIDSVYVEGDRLYVTTYEGVENTEGVSTDGSVSEEITGTEDYVVNGISIQRMYSLKLDGSDLKEIELPHFGEDLYLNQMMVNKDHTYIYLLESFDDKKERNIYVLVKADEKGNEFLREDITKSLNIGRESYVNKVVKDDQDNLMFLLSDRIVCLDSNFKKIFEIKGESGVEYAGIAKMDNGNVIVSYSEERGQGVQILDVAGKTWGEKLQLDVQYFDVNSLMNGNNIYDFYYKDYVGIYGYTIEDKRSTKVMDYLTSNINADGLYSVIALDNGLFFNSYYSDDEIKVVLYTKIDPSKVKNCKTITIAMAWVDDEVKKAAMEFNRKNTEYQIQIKDYSSEEDPMTKMNVDIIAGNIADIILLDGQPVQQYVAKGLLEDLTPYIEVDEEIKSDDFVDSLVEAMKIDGKLYYTTPMFYVNTLMGATKDVGTQTGWTFDDLKRVLEEKGSDVRPFYSESKMDMLNIFSYAISNDFVNWTTGECSYESQEFKDILEFCNTTGSVEEQEYNEDTSNFTSLIMSGKVLLNDYSGDYESLELSKRLYNGDVTFVGYPNAKKEGSFFSTSSSLGIYSKSEVKEGAWQFLRLFLTKDYQCKKVSEGNTKGTPTRKDALEFKNKIISTTEKFKDEYGNEHEPEQSSIGLDDFSIEIGPTTQENIDMNMELINNTKKIADWNYVILGIVYEESKTYFSGDKSVDEVITIIQDRVNTYVNENR